MDTRFTSSNNDAIIVTTLPYGGRGAPTLQTITAFLERARISDTVNLVDATLRSGTTRTVGGRRYFHFEFARPHALVVATVADGNLYTLTAVASSARRWPVVESELRASTESFRVRA